MNFCVLNKKCCYLLPQVGKFLNFLLVHIFALSLKSAGLVSNSRSFAPPNKSVNFMPDVTGEAKLVQQYKRSHVLCKQLRNMLMFRQCDAYYPPGIISIV